MMQFLGSILVAILIPVATGLGTLLGKLIKKAINRIENATLQELAWTAVRWAEQKFKNLPGDERFKKVEEYITEKLPGVNKEDIERAIEAAVKQLHIELGEEVSLPTK